MNIPLIASIAISLFIFKFKEYDNYFILEVESTLRTYNSTPQDKKTPFLSNDRRTILQNKYDHLLHRNQTWYQNLNLNGQML